MKRLLMHLRQRFAGQRVYDFSLAFSEEEYEAMHDAMCNQHDIRELIGALYRR